MKTIEFDNHRIEINFNDSFLFITMKVKGLVVKEGKWTSCDWFVSQLSFPPILITEILKVTRNWLRSYLDDEDISRILPELESNIIDSTGELPSMSN